MTQLPAQEQLFSSAGDFIRGENQEEEEEEEEEEDSITPPRTPASGAGSSDGLRVQTAFDPFSGRGGGAAVVGRHPTAGASEIGSEIGSEDFSASIGMGGAGGDSVEEDLYFPGQDSDPSSAAGAAGTNRKLIAGGGVGNVSESIPMDGVGGYYSDTFELPVGGGAGGSTSLPDEIASSSVHAGAGMQPAQSVAGTVSTDDTEGASAAAGVGQVRYIFDYFNVTPSLITHSRLNL